MIVAHYVVTWLPLTQRWIWNEVEGQQSAGLSPVVVCNELTRDYPVPAQGVVRLKSWSNPYFLFERAVRRATGNVRYNPSLVSLLKRRKVMLLHSHFGTAGWGNLRSARRAGCRHVVTFYGYEATMLPRQKPEWQLRYKEMFAGIDLVLCEGPAFARTIAELGCAPEKIRVHALGIPLADYPFAPVSWDGEAPLRFLLAGRFVEKKGFDVAVGAIGRIARQHRVEITLIGGSDPAEPKTLAAEAAIRRALAASGLSQSARWLGYVSNAVLADEARAHHFFMAPSVTASDGDQEGGAPVSAIEMQAIGLPVIATTHCDLPFVVNQGVTLSPERDVESLERQIQYWIDSPGGWRERLEQGRRHVEAGFDAARQGQRMKEIYREIAG